MANYTDTEIQGVVDQLVRSTIRRPYDTLGVRRTDVTFSDLQESAAGVLLLYPRGPYYLAYLSGQRLKEAVNQLQSLVSSVLDSLGALRRRTLPVRDISSLVNAKTALFELEGAVSQPKPPKSVAKIPAYVRFNTNVDRFLAAAGGNIKQNGAIVSTPEEARMNLPGQVTALKAGYLEMVRKARLLAGCLLDYNSLGLAQLLSAGVVSRARTLLAARADQLAGLNEEARLAYLRQTVLELLGMKSVVKTFGAFAGLGTDGGATGLLTAFADTARPGLPAQIEVASEGALALVPGTDIPSSSNVLTVWVDGAPTGGPPTTQFFLPTSLFPKVEGLNPGPFTISLGKNDQLSFLLDGVTTVSVPITVGSRTAAQVAADFTAGLSAYGFQGEAYFSPLMYDGQVVSLGNTFTLAFGAFPPGSVNVSDQVDIYFGPDASSTRNVTSVITGGGAITGIVVDGAPLSNSSLNRIRYGSPNRRVRVLPIDRKAAVLAKRTLQVKMPTAVERDAGITFGIYGELYGKGTGTDAKVVSDYVSQNSRSVDAVTVQHVIFTGTMTTDPSDAQGLLCASTAGLAADMPIIVPSGVNGGKYYIDSVVSLTKVKLRSGMPQYRDSFNQGVSMDSVTVGFDHYIIRSKTTGLSSSLALTGPTTGGATTALQGPQVGQTPYLTFPNVSKLVSEGDQIQSYITSPATPDATRTVLQVFPDDVVLVDVPIDMTSSISFTSPTIPFVRLVLGHAQDFQTFSAALLQNITTDQLIGVFFENLNGLINPLRVNKNPDDSSIGSAEAAVRSINTLTSALLTAIANYQPAHVPEVDHLIRAFKEKGADRATDLLLEGQFSIFFGLTQEGVSYAGAMQAAVRDVARLDLPIHKSNRLARSISPLRASAASTDFEVEHPDLDTTPTIDPPTEIDQNST